MKKLLKITFTLIFTTIILLDFAMPLNPVGNWYQQFLPGIGGRIIQDITFTDSLNGYAITSEVSDTSFVLRTTNGGDNWTISHFDTGICSYYNIQFVNQNTGYVSGYIYNGSVYRLVKTTNGGNSWFYINHSSDIVAIDMHALSEDTIWVVDSGSLTGGVFFTSNGGASWVRQLDLGSQNPEKIYMFNARIGFITEDNNYIRKTTDGGQSWFIISSSNNRSFRDIFFIDSLKGWLAFDSVRMTTNGGINWTTQLLPYGGIISVFSRISNFSFLNKDTAWGVGGDVLFPNNQVRGFIYRTTNGGNNWLFQIPDTASMQLAAPYRYIQFINKTTGWAYYTDRGIHTTNGGDTSWLLGIKQISSNIPKVYKLYQNYPNPFNPKTNIKYQILKSKYINLIVYDVTGKQMIDLVNRKQSAGTYEVDFSGYGYSSGIYFYSLVIDGAVVDTKKMVLIK